MRKNSVFWAFYSTFHKKFEETVYFHVFRNTLCIVSKKCEKTAFFSAFFARRSAKSVRKQCFFTSFGTLCQSSQKKRFFFCATLCKKCDCSFTFFKTLCTKFAEKEKNQRFLSFFCNFRENSVLSRFLRHFVQISQKISKISVFWAFSATFPKKCEETVFFLRFSRHFKIKFERMRKTSFFELFARCSAKSVRKQCFFFHVFRNTLYKVRKKCWKTAFFDLFLRRSAKSVRKQCFIHFFLRRSAKSVRKQCFFTFFEIICANFARKTKKERFLRDGPQKVWENSVFFHVFWDTLYKVHKTKRFFFSRRFAKSVSVLSRFSRQFVQSSQKIRKMSVFWVFFLRRSPKSVRKQSFFTFFETLCTKFAENAKNSVFWTFYATFCQKCEKTVFFHVFRDTLYIVHIKYEKNSVFWAFCATFRKKCEKTVFFHVFQDTLYKVREKKV